ncbi:MAG: hypothetical protein WC728_17620, partial [Elusimicrobiota bacterium]
MTRSPVRRTLALVIALDLSVLAPARVLANSVAAGTANAGAGTVVPAVVAPIGASLQNNGGTLGDASILPSLGNTLPSAIRVSAVSPRALPSAVIRQVSMKAVVATPAAQEKATPVSTGEVLKKLSSDLKPQEEQSKPSDKAAEVSRKAFDGGDMGPPALDLPELSLPWLPSGSAGSAQAGSKLRRGEAALKGPDSTQSHAGQLTRESVDSPRIRKSEGSAGAEALSLETGSPIQQAFLVPNGILWLDSEGRVFRFDPETGKTEALSRDGEKVSLLTQGADPNDVYAISGGAFQHWEMLKTYAWTPYDTDLGKQDYRSLELVLRDRPMHAIRARLADGRSVYLENHQISVLPETEPAVPEGFQRSGDNLYQVQTLEGTRVYLRIVDNEDVSFKDLGVLPFQVRAMALTARRQRLLAVTDRGLVEWDLSKNLYRVFRVEGLGSGPISLTAQGDAALISSGQRLIRVDLGASSRFLKSEAARVQLWSEQNPMSVKDGVLRIGEFTFPVSWKPQVELPWYTRLLHYFFKGKASSSPSGLTDTEWKVLNLPSNKWVIYNTLKAFTLN